MIPKRLAVFCGAKEGNHPAYALDAREVGNQIAYRKAELVYGGGSVGLMGILAEACASAGGSVHGVIPGFISEMEAAYPEGERVSMTTVRSLEERKAVMINMSDAFLVLPGGLGTMDEAFEVLTWSQLGLVASGKPIGLLNTIGYFDGLIEFLDQALEKRFLDGRHRELLAWSYHPRHIVDDLLGFRRDNVF